MANQQFERTDRIASEIMRETEKIIREDVSDPRTDCMFSITHVDVTRDLRYAKVYVSIYEEEKRAPMMKALKTAAGFIRHNLGRRVQLRYTPELVFELDTTIEYGVHIASLINQVRKTEESRSDDAGEAGICTDPAAWHHRAIRRCPGRRRCRRAGRPGACPGKSAGYRGR